MTTPTKYTNDLAGDYGLTIHVDKTSILLRLQDRLIIALTELHPIAWSWDVWPLGEHHGHRRAEGFAGSQDEAMGDAEGLLRHYLQNTPTNEVLEVWPMETMLDQRVLKAELLGELFGYCLMAAAQKVRFLP